ncbi:LysR family transcriptional regulator [Coralliovum pocilloporae]|uniref:LysR family transcriptional regulator n=1 Tax=Coralliovum pocilloporae TaxID=3066369 RepID=UPI003306F4DE
MQLHRKISLNSLRVFLSAAGHGSLKAAAMDLGVTPGAVSHQIKTLEAVLGVELFVRTNNTIRLTEAGEGLLAQALPGLKTMEAALENVVRQTHELTVRVSVTLATRWLIPRLGLFNRSFPNARVQLETVNSTGQPPGPEPDISILYYKYFEIPPQADCILSDASRPYLSPMLLQRIADPGDLEAIPAIECTRNNWDWHSWLAATEQSGTRLSYAGSFDFDDAALRAAVAGVGMVLSPDFMIRDDLEAGRLCALPGAEAAVLGSYVIRRGVRETALADSFVRWLKQMAEDVQAL